MQVEEEYELRKRIAVLEHLVAALFYINDDLLIDPSKHPIKVVPLSGSAKQAADDLNELIAKATEPLEKQFAKLRKTAVALKGKEKIKKDSP